jgi:NMD protein affecting ribosome stability and mRNA decay
VKKTAPCSRCGDTCNYRRLRLCNQCCRYVGSLFDADSTVSLWVAEGIINAAQEG